MHGHCSVRCRYVSVAFTCPLPYVSVAFTCPLPLRVRCRYGACQLLCARGVQVSDYSLFLSGLPKSTSARTLAVWMERFGPVLEVQLATDDHEFFEALFERSRRVLALKRAQQSVRLGIARKEKVRVARERLGQIDAALQRRQAEHRDAVVGAFVTFDAERDRNKALHFLSANVFGRWFR